VNSGLNWLGTEPTYEEFASTVETLVDVQEEPFAGPSIMMQYEVVKTARSNGVIVLLDGQGGDETLLGYHRYYAAWLLDKLKRNGRRVRICIATSAGIRRQGSCFWLPEKLFDAGHSLADVCHHLVISGKVESQRAGK
jgi:asparagine synthase (glutamine-hydrolysing)